MVTSGKNKGSFIKAFTTITFLATVIINTLANTLPINGVTTGQVSDSYKNFFAPAGITFAIWGLIYLLLAGYTIYQFIFFNSNKSVINRDLFEKVGLYFSISSLFNITWIFAWHYDYIGLSMIFMIIILICLILINKEINKNELTTAEKIFIKIPFSIYFGWITVATIANATTLLVSIGWDGFGISEQTWTIIMIIVGLVIGVITMIRNDSITYGITIIWAYLGILIKHTSEMGFSNQYPAIITTTIISIIVLITAVAYLFISKTRKL